MKEVVIKYRKLLRHRALGLAYTDSNLIEIEERLRGQELLYILCHELSHIYYPDMEEKDIINLSAFLSTYIWREGFRKVDQ